MRVKGLNRSIMLMAAKRFALATPSDPFAYARAVTHLNNGIAEYRAGKEQEPAYYDAEEGTETRVLPDGTEYQATIWRNLRRP